MENFNPSLLGSAEPNPFIPKPPANAEKYYEFFVYEVPVFTNLPITNGTQTQTLQIQNDADFEWVAGTFEFDVAAAAVTFATRNMPNMTIVITDTGSGAQLMNAPVPVVSLFGNAHEPKYLPISKVFGRNSAMQFTATNFDAAVATGNLRLSLLGWKIFYF